jgi:hypothetical protein
MALNLGWSSKPNESFDFEKDGGSKNSPFEAEGF